MGIALTTEDPVSMFAGCFTDGTTDCGKNYWYRDVTAVDYHCFAIRRELFGQVSGFFQREEPTFEISGSDLWMFDFCLRLRALGYRHMGIPLCADAPEHRWQKDDDVRPDQRTCTGESMESILRKIRDWEI